MLHFHCLVLNGERTGEENLSSNRIRISKAPFSVQAPWGYCIKSFWTALRSIGEDIKAALIPGLTQTWRHLRSHSQARKILGQLLVKPSTDLFKRWTLGEREQPNPAASTITLEEAHRKGLGIEEHSGLHSTWCSSMSYVSAPLSIWALSSCECPCSLQGSWSRWLLKVSSNSNNSVILRSSLPCETRQEASGPSKERGWKVDLS